MEATGLAQKTEGAVTSGAEKARSRMEEQVGQRSTQGAEQARVVADDMRSVGEELRRRGRESPARMVDAIADRAERMSGYLERSEGGTIIEDATRYGRRHPSVVALGGFAVGFAAARFLKASESGGGGFTPSGGAREGIGWSSPDAPAPIPAPPSAGQGGRDAIRPAGSPR